MDTWTLEDATHELPEVVRRALDHQPQVVVRAGDEEDAVVVVARSEYERLQRPKQTMRDFFRNSPLAEAVAAGEIDLDSLRSDDPPRDVNFG